MRPIIIIVALGLCAWAGVSWAAPARPVQAHAVQVIVHDLPRCVVTRANIQGARPKFEVVYQQGNIEHHLFVADRSAAKAFFKNPERYMKKVAAMEKP